MATVNVIAIHGTFAKDAVWHSPQGILAKKLREELKNAGHFLKWTAFTWTGSNSHQGRENAALQLVKDVAALPANSEGQLNILLGHSHGGNVALMALAMSEESRRKIDGVVCLSTPFIEMDSNDLEEAEVVYGQSFGFFPILASFMGVFFGLLILSGFDPSSAAPIPSLVWWGLLAQAVLVAVSLGTLTFLKYAIFPSRLRYISFFYSHELIVAPVLCLRTKADEALAWVRIISGIANIPEALRIGAVSVMVLSAAALGGCFVGGFFFAFAGVSIGSFVTKALFLAITLSSFLPYFYVMAKVVRAIVRVGPWSWGEHSLVGVLYAFRATSRLRDLPSARNEVVAADHGENYLKLAWNHSYLTGSKRCGERLSLFVLELIDSRNLSRR